MVQEKDIKPILDIDVNNLVDECIVQPKMYLKYAAQLRKANDDVVDTKGELKRVEAMLATKIRKNPKKYKVDKLTDLIVTQTVTLRPLYQKALRAYNEALSLQGRWEVMVKAVYQRKDMLQEAIKLHGQGYFAVPYVKGDLSKLLDETRANKAFKSRKKKKKKS
jgi:hypothetical protein